MNGQAAVFNMSKIQTWKRITTRWRYEFHILVLYLICQRYKLESESQHGESVMTARAAVFNMSKIQTWKRITTPYHRQADGASLYLICQRYKLESESQRTLAQFRTAGAVFNMSKIQTWKRITTIDRDAVHDFVLYLICQRYKLESESQRHAGRRCRNFGCI